MPPDPPPRPRYEVARLSDIAHTTTDERHVLQLPGEWKQIRHHFGIREFAANAFIATEPGQELVHEHVETPNDDSSDIGDEELYYIAKGSAVVTLDGEKIDVEEGSFIFVGDPSVQRSVTATGGYGRAHVRHEPRRRVRRLEVRARGERARAMGVIPRRCGFRVTTQRGDDGCSLGS